MIESPELFCDEVEKFSKMKLLVKSDLQTLVSTAFNSLQEELFFSIAFSAKYVRGLIRVLQQTETNPEIKNLEQLKKDLSENMEQITSNLKILLATEAENVKDGFEEKYLFLTTEAFANFQNLLNDLEWVKIYQNHLKRIK
ncbi:MAG: hypothetical protein COZ80_07220 [Ignavibacteria bacterium CG_4_8_14_3_um_filter_37_9]|nr:hypothetical protein [Ignavibacteria bacterium]OIO15798.1 MAG: hypothetical protein AUJ54_12350 [Ignavibacteria bacterium CG1_02_37_35]PIS46405.1 MAG: hypothetical protein COT22_00175 [Ignavibacteria bacterium CG08_land_8_20_14_0_20_37_9]PIW99086.1 MAG: hypothetical protein COZ80_07220 [Ignavibacteria bacterium CG_4_8_14_3_um_filter_37_9]PIX93285.1 MAG: hypothetical protein COZ25_11595 [Ignavibacteria bacterium CG_4_10_14_3_um_filter_37_18]PJC59239.1 MAG: hypothetical protein CO025_06795 [I